MLKCLMTLTKTTRADDIVGCKTGESGTVHSLNEYDLICQLTGNSNSSNCASVPFSENLLSPVNMGIMSEREDSECDNSLGSPVKEGAAQLMAAALLFSCVDSQESEFGSLIFQTMRKTLEMCRYDKTDNEIDLISIHHSGLLIMKHLLKQDHCLEVLLNGGYSEINWLEVLADILLECICPLSLRLDCSRHAEIRDTAFRVFTSLACGLQALSKGRSALVMESLLTNVIPIVMHAVNGIGDKMSSILAGEIDILDRRLVVETVSDDSNSLGYSCLRCIEALVSLTSIVLFNDTIILSRNSMSSDPFYMTTLSCVSAMSKFIQRCQEDKVVKSFYACFDQIIGQYSIALEADVKRNEATFPWRCNDSIENKIWEIIGHIACISFTREMLLTGDNCNVADDDLFSGSFYSISAARYLCSSISVATSHSCDVTLRTNPYHTYLKFFSTQYQLHCCNAKKQGIADADIRDNMGASMFGFCGMKWVCDIVQWALQVCDLTLFRANGMDSDDHDVFKTVFCQHDFLNYLYVNDLNDYSVRDTGLDEYFLRGTRCFSLFCGYFLRQSTAFIVIDRDNIAHVAMCLQEMFEKICSLLNSASTKVNEEIDHAVTRWRNQSQAIDGSIAPSTQQKKRKFFVVQSSSAVHKRKSFNDRGNRSAVENSCPQDCSKSAHKLIKKMLLISHLMIQYLHELHSSGLLTNFQHLNGAISPVIAQMKEGVMKLQRANVEFTRILLSSSSKSSLKEIQVLSSYMKTKLQNICSACIFLGCEGESKYNSIGDIDEEIQTDGMWAESVLKHYFEICDEKEFPTSNPRNDDFTSNLMTLRHVLQRLVCEDLILWMNETAMLLEEESMCQKFDSFDVVNILLGALR